MSRISYRGYRIPPDIIQRAVWLYFRFCLSFRDVEELLFERGVVVTYEAIRKWCRKFGQRYANQLRRHRPRPGDKWHMDEVFLTIHGERHYLWRAVDQDGHVLDILLQRRRNKGSGQNHVILHAKGLQKPSRRRCQDPHFPLSSGMARISHLEHERVVLKPLHKTVKFLPV